MGHGCRHRCRVGFVDTAVTGTRVLFFTNECVGLGHLRRALTLAAAVTEADRDASAVIVTGAPVELANPLPPRVDTVKLPLLARNAEGVQRAGRLGIELPDVHAMRSELAHAVARSFAPTVAVVDKMPLGLGDELSPALEWLSACGTKLVLGLRDISDAPERVRSEWERPAVKASFERLYDAIAVYGPPGARRHALACITWEPRVPVHALGYVGAPPAPLPADVPPDYLLATAGGGSDGFALLATFLDAVRLDPLPVPALAVTGPLMPEPQVRDLRARASDLDVTLETFRPGLDGAMAAARGVVAMAGYNTVSELMRTGRPALLVPRTQPSREQLLRAELLQATGRVDVLRPDELDAARMRRALERLLAAQPHPPDREHAGARRFAEVVDALAHETDPDLAEVAS
jgi:predicted glycosyltransferase